MTKIYFYKNCDSCRKALRFLDEHNIEYQKHDLVVESPPPLEDLKRGLQVADGNIRKLFNSSGMEYRKLNMRDKLPTLSDDEALGLLAGNGRMIKRPLLLDDAGGLIGFKPAEWEAHFG